MNKPNRDYPLWETLVMVASFVMLWAWLIARQSARTSGGQLWPGWTVLQVMALIALVVITVRRLARVRRSLRGEDNDNDNHPRPSQFPPLNGHANKR